VKEGDLVAKIDDTDYKVRLEQAQAQYTKALLNQNVAKANLNAVNSEIDAARKDLERYTNLYKTGAVSKQALDNAQTKFDTIKARQLSAEQNILSASNNKVADADIKVLKALRDQAELNLKYTNVLAPRDGTVTNKKVEKGAYVQVGQPLFVIVPDEVWVVANFKENQVGKMKPGQEVLIKVDAYPKEVFKGKIDSIQRASGSKSSLFPPENAVGSFVKIVQRIPVKIIFTEPINKEEYNIVAGMSVIPKVRVK
jgi:membrane fusion protein (multidrug efflux system)